MKQLVTEGDRKPLNCYVSVMVTPSSSTTVPSRARIILVASGLTLLSGLNCGWIGPLIPRIAQVQHLSLVETGSIVSASMFGAMCMNFLGKFLIDRFGGPYCLKIAGLTSACGLAGLAFSQGFVGLALSGLVWGFGSGLNTLSSATSVLANSTTNAASTMNRINVFFGLGALFGPLLAWLALNYNLGYSCVFLFGICLALTMTALGFKFPRAILGQGKASGGAAQGASSSSSSSSVLGHAGLWLFAAIIFLYVGIETSCAAWLYTFLAKFTKLDLSLCAFSMSVLWGGLTFGRLISIKLCSKYSPYTVTTLATILIMVSLALLSSLSGLGFLALVLVFLMGLGFAPIYPNSIGLANERYPASKSTATMVVICSGSLGGTILPLAIGAAFTKLSLQFGMTSLAFVALAMSFLIRLTRELAAKKEPSVVAANLNDDAYCEIQS